MYLFVILIRIFEVLYYFHSNDIVYRDLNPSNILVDNNFRVYVNDFESFKTFIEEMTYNVATEKWCAPEQYEGLESGNKVSFGKIIYFLFEKNEISEMNFICQDSIPLITNIPNDMAILMDFFIWGKYIIK